MKNLVSLWTRIAEEIGDACQVSTARDSEYVTRRVEAEGVSFLTITLPSFAKGLEDCLREGVYNAEFFPGFRKFPGSVNSYPSFLGGFFEHIFDPMTDAVRPCTDSSAGPARAIWAVRQLSLLFSKIEIECSDERKMAAIEKYKEIEKELADAEVEAEDEDGEVDPFGLSFIASPNCSTPGYYTTWMKTSWSGISWDVMGLVTPQIVFLATPSTILWSGQRG